MSTVRPVPAAFKGAAQGRAERRFAVHRNTVAASLIEALQARFPVVQRLVGEDFFRAMARAFVALEPPSSPLLFLYGESFAAFIARFSRRRRCLISPTWRGSNMPAASLTGESD